MKKILLITLLFISLAVNAQTYKLYQTHNIHNQLKLNTITGEIYQIQDDGLKLLVNKAKSTNTKRANRYFLVETENMWTFILVDSYTGKLWQTQYSVDSDGSRFSLPINEKSLSKTMTSKFTVQPLISMFQFYLINSNTGELWKFQWSTESDSSYRWIKKMD